MTTPPISLTVDQSIATIRLNRPDAGNAIDLPLVRALLDAAIRCETDPAIRCVVLTGSGRLFCAGGDLELFRGAGASIDAVLSELAGLLHMALLRFARMDKPLIVLVNGPAAGAGFSLAISGDFVLCARTAHFTAAYSGVGLTPDGGMTWTLPRLVGLRRAQDIILSNRRVGAEEAEAIGIVTRLVDGTELEAEGMALARKLADGPSSAIGAARRLLLGGLQNEFSEQLDCEEQAIVLAAASANCREAVSAYFEKRKPDWN